VIVRRRRTGPLLTAALAVVTLVACAADAESEAPAAIPTTTEPATTEPATTEPATTEPAGTVEVSSGRDGWETCPPGWEGYAAAACPVDLLGPISTAAANDARLVLSTRIGDVTCAPERTAPPPPGRRVGLRLEQRWRSCATDFALVLVADREGRLTAVDLTLSKP
jgi:hypothetical protein